MFFAPKKVTNIAFILTILIIVITLSSRNLMIKIVSFVPYMQLKSIPPPLEMERESMTLPSNWVLVYESTLSLEIVTNFYINELPKKGWDVNLYENGYTQCILAEKDNTSKIIEIQERGRTYVYVGFAETPLFCK